MLFLPPVHTHCRDIWSVPRPRLSVSPAAFSSPLCLIIIFWASPHHHTFQWLSLLLLNPASPLAYRMGPSPSLPSQAASLLRVHSHVPSKHGSLNCLSVHPSLPLLTSITLGTLLLSLESSFPFCSRGELLLFLQIWFPCLPLCEAAPTSLREHWAVFLVRAHTSIRVPL